MGIVLKVERVDLNALRASWVKPLHLQTENNDQ
jgi:hypothetical protein